jgi:hypothetical protein
MNSERSIHLILVSIALAVSACGGGGDGGGGGGGNNPVPTIGNIMPGNGFTADAATQASAQMMTINGTNFISTTSVLWNGTPLTGVTVVGDAQLTVPVPPSDLQIPGTATVVVSNPSPGGGNSTTVAVSINPPTPANPALAPANVSALSGGFQLEVHATNVLSDSVVIWNYGNANAVVLSTQLTTPPGSTGGTGTLTAVVTSGLIANAGMVPVVVANPNADGSITTAISGTTSFTVSAPVATACLLAGLRNYAFLGTGLDQNGAASMVGSFRIDDTGAVVNAINPIVNSFTDFKDPVNLFAVNNGGTLGRISGAAGSCVDNAGVPGTGKVQFTVSGIPGDTFTLNYTLRASGNGGRITLTDTLYGLKATGQIEIQFSTNSFNLGSFAFGLLGQNAAATRYAVVGAMCTSSPVFLQADFDDNGTPATATASGWSFVAGDATTGRTTSSQLTFNNGRSLVLTVYGVNGGKAYAMESSLDATSRQVLSGVITGFKGNVCLPTGVGGSFGNASFVNSVFGLSGEAASVATVTLGILAPSGGGRCPEGRNGTVTADVNTGGAARTLSSASVRTCFSVAASGRGSLQLIDARNITTPFATFYLDGTGGGYALGTGDGIPFGFIQPQATPAPLPSIGGNYGFAPFTFPGALLPVTSVAINAASATSGTITDNAAGGSATTMPYTLDTTTGRGTATLNSAVTFGDTQVVFYESATQQLYIMDAAATSPVIGALIQ